jgi:hypothetical protein
MSYNYSITNSFLSDYFSILVRNMKIIQPTLERNTLDNIKFIKQSVVMRFLDAENHIVRKKTP